MTSDRGGSSREVEINRAKLRVLANSEAAVRNTGQEVAHSSERRGRDEAGV